MTVALLEFRIKRGIIDHNNLDDENLSNAIKQTIQLAAIGNFDDAVKSLPPIFSSGPHRTAMEICPKYFILATIFD